MSGLSVWNTRLELLDKTARVRLVIQPIASIENHGVLPLGADLLIADCVMKNIRLPRGVVVAPTIPYSTAIEHQEPRVSVNPQMFIQYLVEVGSSLLSIADTLLFAVFHGGAYHATYLAARILRSMGNNVVLFNFWDTVTKAIGLKDVLVHADCIEASILLACGYDKGIRETEQVDPDCTRIAPHYQPWVSLDVPDLYPRDSVPASRTLGEKLLRAASAQLRELVESILEQLEASSR
ncbi:hypothetical protein Pdsh_03520 [Pyrodictium delaneyi]|uniref:Creatinine amidohydrolase n=1 Tax=Pyrodictium delaneyi TaxID=1273541 RepID=A0A211YPN4_9CREN|nr:hypothetical protein Pdsh_03520 [Pyrodictium delaneyi]